MSQLSLRMVRGGQHLKGSSLLIEKSRLKSIRDLSLPIIGGMLAQNLMSLIDIAMVGQLGNAPLASMGVSNFLFMLMFSALAGIGTGVQAQVARRVGEGKIQEAGYVLNAGILISVATGLLLAIFGYLTIKDIYALINKDPDVVKHGISYLWLRLPSMLFIGVNICFRSYWIGVNLPKWSLVSIFVSTFVNIICNYLLIFGNLGFPQLGTAGAGAATSVATMVAVATHFLLGIKYARTNGFLFGLPAKMQIKTLVKISLPESIRSFYFFLGVVVFLAIVGMLGTEELAAFNVILNIMLVAILPVIGMGIAALTLVGQALGREDIRDAKQWGWETARAGAGVLLFFGIGLILFPEAVVGLFTTDEKIVEIASVPMRIMGLYLWVEAFGRILSFALLGAGASKVVMIWSFLFQWCLALPLYWVVGVHLGYGLTGIFINSLFVAILNTLIFSFIWHNDRWSLIKV